MSLGPAQKKSTDALIARILVGKPDVSPSLLRRILPNLDQLDDRALAQKIEYLRIKNGRRRPIAY